MDHVEMHDTDEHKTNTTRKKPSLLRRGSYRIVYLTKKRKQDVENNDQNIDKKSSKMKPRNGLKRFFFLHKTPCELSLPDQTNELSLPVTSTAQKLSKKEPNEDETIVQNHLLTRTDRLESTSRKQDFLVNLLPDIQASVHRRRRRFMAACGTVIVALTIIITIIIYAIIMTINHRIQMSQSSYRNYPR